MMANGPTLSFCEVLSQGFQEIRDSAMIGTIAIAILITVLLDGGMIILLQRSYPRFVPEGIHWLALIICASITVLCISITVGAITGKKALQKKADHVVEYTNVIDSMLGTEKSDMSVTKMAKQQVSYLQTAQCNKLTTTIVLSLLAVFVSNSLLFWYLSTEGKKSKRRRRHTYSNPGDTSIDNF